MRGLSERYRLKDYEFTDYKFRSKASKRVRQAMRRAMKRGWKNRVRDEIIKQTAAKEYSGT